MKIIVNNIRICGYSLSSAERNSTLVNAYIRKEKNITN